jgi:hypothetical protein
MLVLPRSAILAGTGHVGPEQRAQFVGSVAGSVGGWIALSAGLALYSVVVIVGLRSAVGALMLAKPYRPFGQLRVESSEAPTIRWGELWPLQWRMSVSWLAGILTYQSMVPLTFIVLGPITAGQIGILSQIFLAVTGLGSIWLVSAQPRLGQLAAARRFEEIRLLVRITASRCAATAAFVGLAALMLVSAIESARPDIGARFGSPWLLLVLVLAAVVMQAGAPLVAAVRFQKREPFVRLGLVSSALSIGLMAFGATSHGLVGVVIGFSAVIIALITPWSAAIYFREMARQEALGSVSRAEWQRLESPLALAPGRPPVGEDAP